MSNAHLSFLPWVRQGVAAAIVAPDTLGPLQPAVASVATELRLNDAPVPGIRVWLRGPADVVGFDPRQVIRTDPPPASTDFEPNCFASIELDRPDFPWMFTPARADAQSRLRPWLCLVVVRRQEGVRISSPPGMPLPVLQIDDPLIAAQELPNLQDAWAWAHAQVAADEDASGAISRALEGQPDRSLSRLVCPRLLSPQTDYLAVVVPTFELGRRAGLGTSVSQAELEAPNALAAAWLSPPRADAALRLPVYYQWEFRTGQSDDFDTLARRLRPAAPAGLGQRMIDISHPGFDAHGAATVLMQGPLLPIDAPLTQQSPAQTVPAAFKSELAGILNLPELPSSTEPAPDPVVAPPIYGQWHARRFTVSPGGSAWLDELNLHPALRVTAGLGTQVVQRHQEALMASAWEQAGAIAAGNQRLRQLQMGLSVSESLQRRHIRRLSEEMTLRVAAPAFGRLQAQPGMSLLAEQASSRLPLAANGWAMRRIGRQRGPLRRRVRLQTGAPAQAVSASWISLMNSASSTASDRAAPRPPDLCVIPSLPVEHLATSSNFGVFFVAAQAAPVAWPGPPVLVANRTELPGHFRDALLRHLSKAPAVPANPPSPLAGSFEGVRDRVLIQMEPARAYAALAGALFSGGQQGTAIDEPSGVDTLTVVPSFPQPMAEALTDLGPELLLPGVNDVPQDSVVGLRTNRRFVEAYMAGLNHEMARELLWRGFPTDQRGTCFAHFWRAGHVGAPPDIDDLEHWDERALGDPAYSPAGETFVMLLRSPLLRRYPNAVIHLTPGRAVEGDPRRRVPDTEPAKERAPLFRGSLPPDMAYIGFDVPVDVATGADGGPGYFVVIQEHPTAPRFGLDAGLDLGGASHLAIGSAAPPGMPLQGATWGGNAAAMAVITRRLPTRLVIHASRLIQRP